MDMKAVALLDQRMKWVVLGLALVLTGCQTTGTTPAANQAPVDPRLANSSSAQFFSKSGWQACAGGAVVGARARVAAQSGVTHALAPDGEYSGHPAEPNRPRLVRLARLRRMAERPT